MFDANQRKGGCLRKNDLPDETESAHTNRLEVDITRGNLKNLSMKKAYPSVSRPCFKDLVHPAYRRDMAGWPTEKQTPRVRRSAGRTEYDG